MQRPGQEFELGSEGLGTSCSPVPGAHPRDQISTVHWGTFLLVQWFRIHASKAGDTGLIPGQGTKILHVIQYRITQLEKKLKAKRTTEN